MSFFVLSVQPRKEEAFLAAAGDQLDPDQYQFLWPRRKLTIRRRGKRVETITPVFPGYIFVESDSIPRQIVQVAKRLPGFYRFLDSNEQIRPLDTHDQDLVAHFIRFGEIVGKSDVTFDANNRIQVVSGPLSGLEGMIVKVDKRKRRAKIRLDLYNDSFLVDFGFEIIAPASSPPNGGR